MHNRTSGLYLCIRMRVKPALLLTCALLVCTAVRGAPSVPSGAQGWLSRVPSLPATTEAAYAQWVDVSGRLTPGPESNAVAAGIKAELLVLARPVESPAGSNNTLSAHDEALIPKISVFPASAGIQQKIQAAQKAQASLLQAWRNELNALEQQRIEARGALPACHNEAGTPSQLSIRDVERTFSDQKKEIAVHYLAQFQPLVEQLL